LRVRIKLLNARDGKRPSPTNLSQHITKCKAEVDGVSGRDFYNNQAEEARQTQMLKLKRKHPFQGIAPGMPKSK
jgi:hypothetical protein